MEIFVKINEVQQSRLFAVIEIFLHSLGGTRGPIFENMGAQPEHRVYSTGQCKNLGQICLQNHPIMRDKRNN